MATAATKSATSSTSERDLGRLFAALCIGIVGAWLAVLLEVVALLIAGRGQLAGIWEIQFGVVGFLPAWLLLAVPPGAMGGLFAEAARRRLRPGSLMGLAFLGGCAVGWGVGGGRHLADVPLRLAFALVVGAAVAAAMNGAVAGVRKLLLRLPLGMQGAAALAWGVLFAVLLEAINASVLVRLYPAFHAGLSFAAVFCVATGWALWAPAPFVSPRYPPVVGAVVLLLAVGLFPLSRRVAGFDNFRWLVTETNPTLAFGVDLASAVAPPPPLEEAAVVGPLGSRRSRGAVDWRGKSLLLVTVDALRADHVGAYGYERPTTPFLDQLARSGVAFDAAYAPTPHTSYSVTSLMTGKYMRPLLLQGAGTDSALFADLMRKYGYRTAGFYPPAVFYIDSDKFEPFSKRRLGFEYAKVEFAEGEKRIAQIDRYLKNEPPDQKLFLWLHLFGPHEPYERHEEFDFGQRDIDRYDSEIRFADETIRRAVKKFREWDPEGVVVVSADHGEEFREHGGRYHGTTVYEEQIRVPLIVDAPELEGGRSVGEPVQTIDILPTVLSALRIPIPPRIRGRDLTPLLADGASKTSEDGPDGSSTGPQPAPKELKKGGMAMAETEQYMMLAEGDFRLICQRRSGACQLFHLASDPLQKTDVSQAHPQVFQQLRDKARALASSHGKYETQGLRAEGKDWPAAIVRGLGGDAEVAPELARLLDDADPTIRKKSAQLLFDLGTTGQAPALRLALRREEEAEVRDWLALALTRLGQGAPLVRELLQGDDREKRRLAALALAEQGDDSGEQELIRWWSGDPAPSHEEAVAILEALAEIRSTEAVTPLILRLDEVRLRPRIARTLATIGDRDALPHLALALGKERYHSARGPLAEAVVGLGGDDELIVPLRRFLGVPDPMADGLELALRAGILDDIGGPERADQRRLRQLSDSGVHVNLIVPGVPGGGRQGEAKVRFLALVKNHLDREAKLLVERGTPRNYSKEEKVRFRNLPEIQESKALEIELPRGEEWRQVIAELPEHFGAKPGHALPLQLFAEGGVELKAVAAVPLRPELPPPPPEPWQKQGSTEN